MVLAFLGTGSAFSLERYNGAIVVDGRILLDGGAPLLPHMHRLGIDPGGIDVVFLTHFHGDHVLGLPTFMLHRSFISPGGALTVVGPAGLEEHLEALFRLSWGSEWPEFRQRIGLGYDEGRESGTAAGVEYGTVMLDHGTVRARGYRLRIGGRLIAYAGDAQATEALDRLVEGVEVAITEATQPGPSPVHTSWEEAEELAARHPETRFIFNHVHRGDPPQAVRDLEIVNV